jgi:hypothetical protein
MESGGPGMSDFKYGDMVKWVTQKSYNSPVVTRVGVFRGIVSRSSRGRRLLAYVDFPKLRGDGITSKEVPEVELERVEAPDER